MKICIFAHTFPRFSGDPSAPFMGELAKALGKIVDLFVLLPYDEKLKSNSFKEFKTINYKYIWPLNLHKLGYSRTLQGDKNMKLETYLLSPLLIFFGLLKLIWLIKKEKINLVSAHWMLPNGFVAAVAKKITGTKYTITIPGSDVFISGKNPLFKLMASVAVNGASCVISDSSYYLKQLKSLGITSVRSTVIRYGVDTNKFNIGVKDIGLLKKLNLSAQDKIVLGVGRFVEKKGFIYLLKAFMTVNKIYKNAKLVLVGDGSLKKEFEDYVKRNNLTDYVVFPGMVSHDELQKYYNLADVFVMPSIHDEAGNIDASPVAMMEAMSCGTPVVTTKFSGSGDIIINGKTGYMVEEKNYQQISKAVTSFLTYKNKQENKLLIRKIAQENFSTQVISNKYLDEFKKCLS